MIRNILTFVVTQLALVGSFYATCEIDPFPPYPPSPPEFQKSIGLQITDNGILASWEVVPDQEGYLVSICNDSRGYRPITMGVTSEQLLIENPGVAGVYHVLVKAFVKVQESFVFNGGKVAYISWPGNKAQLTEETGVSVNVTGETIEIIQAPANITRVKGEAPESIIAAFPAFTPSQSFYSAEYPSVSNPFMPQPTPDGRMAPALLTDDGITETVARVSKKWEGRRKPPKNSEVILAKVPQSGLQKGLAPVGSETPTQEQSEKPSAGSAQDLKKLVTPQKSIDKIPTQGAKEQQETKSSEAPKNKNSDLLIYLIAGFIVLAFIYFIFQKEEK